MVCGIEQGVIVGLCIRLKRMDNTSVLWEQNNTKYICASTRPIHSKGVPFRLLDFAFKYSSLHIGIVLKSHSVQLITDRAYLMNSHSVVDFVTFSDWFKILDLFFFCISFYFVICQMATTNYSLYFFCFVMKICPIFCILLNLIRLLACIAYWTVSRNEKKKQNCHQ